jgi:hypothetical protein
VVSAMYYEQASLWISCDMAKEWIISKEPPEFPAGTTLRKTSGPCTRGDRR